MLCGAEYEHHVVGCELRSSKQIMNKKRITKIMTFTENIYQKISTLRYISTDEFSTEWLGQSRSYYSSNKARGLEASNTALVKLMNKITEHKQALETRTNHPVLLNAAMEYQKIANEIATEVANRSMKTNLANQTVKEMLYKIVNETNDLKYPSAPPIIIGF